VKTLTEKAHVNGQKARGLFFTNRFSQTSPKIFIQKNCRLLHKKSSVRSFKKFPSGSFIEGLLPDETIKGNSPTQSRSHTEKKPRFLSNNFRFSL
jgi:hypothetical protein